MNKATGSQVLLTSDDIYRWQAEIQEAEATKAKAQAIIDDRRKKLDYAAFLAGADSGPIRVQDNEQESMRGAIERILAASPRPLFHHELQAELRKTPRFAEMLDKHKGAYYYTLIKRLADSEPPKIKKVGKKKIRLIHNNEAPPEGNPEGAP